MNTYTDFINSFPFTEKKKSKKPAYKKPLSVKQLEKDYQRYHYASKTTPENLQCPFKFRDDTANGLTKCICYWLRMKGYFAGRVNTTGIYDQKLGRYIYSGAKRGMADITSVKKWKTRFDRGQSW